MPTPPLSLATPAGTFLPRDPTAQESMHGGHQDRESRQRYRERLLSLCAWAVPGIVMAVLGFLGIARSGFSPDEHTTWSMLPYSLEQLWYLGQQPDNAVKPYHVFMHAWAQLCGDSTFAMRVPSAWAMVATASLVGLLGTRLRSRHAGLIGGVLFALLPTSTQMAQEASPVAVTVLASVVATTLLTTLLKAPTLFRLLMYSISVAAVGLMSLTALTLLAAHFFVVLLIAPAIFVRWLVAISCAIAALTPLLWCALSQQTQAPFVLPSSFTTLLQFSEGLFGSSFLAGIVVVLAVLSMSAQWPSAMVSCWAVVPTAIIFAVGHVTAVWSPHYVLFVSPAWVLLAALTLDRFSLAASLAVVTVIAGAVLHNHIVWRAEEVEHVRPERSVVHVLPALYRR